MLNTVGGVMLEGWDVCCDWAYLRTAGPYTQPPWPTPFVKRSPIEGEIISPTTRKVDLAVLTVDGHPLSDLRVELLHGVRGQHDLVIGAAPGARPAVTGGWTYPFNGSKARRALTRCPSIAALP